MDVPLEDVNHDFSNTNMNDVAQIAPLPQTIRVERSRCQKIIEYSAYFILGISIGLFFTALLLTISNDNPEANYVGAIFFITSVTIPIFIILCYLAYLIYSSVRNLLRRREEPVVTL
jgi:uncharacterized protein with PQ loop repeat